MPWKSLITIISLTILLVVALLKGVDGAILASGMSLISGVGGFTIGRVTRSHNQP